MRIALIVLGSLSFGCVGTYSEADLAAHLDRVCPLVDLRSMAPPATAREVAAVSLARAQEDSDSILTAGLFSSDGRRSLTSLTLLGSIRAPCDLIR